MFVGYMRISTSETLQSTDLQRDALVAAGVDPRNLHVDMASGAKVDRPGLKECLAYLTAGDVLVVWKLDRLGRSLPHLVGLLENLRGRGVRFRSLTEGMPATAHSARRCSSPAAARQNCWRSLPLGWTCRVARSRSAA